MIFGELIIICYLCIAEEKVDDGFMPMTPKKPDGVSNPIRLCRRKKRTQDLSNFFKMSSILGSYKNVDKFFSKANKTVTRKSV